MTRRIKKVAIIGSGIMGSGIACHFANIGVEVLLLDIVPRELNDKEKAKGLTLEDTIVRNRLVNGALAAALKSKPSPIYNIKFADRITTGNIDDDLHLIKDVDWVMEVVVERLDIKHQLYADLAKHMQDDAILTSNTSTIPISLLTQGMDANLQERFAITHFFNPVRYMRLLELVRGEKTRSDIMQRLSDFSEKELGKGVVHCADTPGFLANRVGCYAIQFALHEDLSNLPCLDSIFHP